MPRKLPGSAIVPGSITLDQITGSINDTTNAAYSQANTARNTANDAYGQANTARSDANTTFATVNTSLGTINTNYQAAYAQANNARSDANTTFATVNTTFGTINTSLSTINSSFSTTNTNYQAAYAQANTARDTANNAYNNSNTKLSTSGGSISGDLSITGNLVVQGNATTINVSNLSVNDSIILLATGSTGDSTDIGFIGHIQRGATDTHVGLIRKATQNQFYLFDNYEVEPTNNVIDVAGNNFRVGNLRLGIINANSYVTSAGMDVTGQANAAYSQANAAYGQANSAYGAANNRVLKAGDTMTGNLTLSSASPMIRLQESGSGGDKRLDLRVNSGGVAFISADQSSQELAFTTTGTERVRITSGGNVGIGTTNPAEKLHIQDGKIAVVGDTATPSTGHAFFYKQSAGATVSGYQVLLETGSAGSRQTRATVDFNGNIGIGTTSPAYRVQINRTEPDALGVFRALDVGVVGAAGTFIDLGALSGSTATAGARIIGVLNNPATSGYMTFSTLNSSTLGERMIITAAGNVGIGITNPAYRLHVQDATATGNIAIGHALYPGLIYSNAGSGEFRIDNRASSTAGYITFYANGQQTSIGTEAMRIDTNGHVIVGTTSPNNTEGWHRVIEGKGLNHSKILTTTTTSNVVTGMWSHSSGFYGAPAGGIAGTYSNHPYSLITNSNTRLTIASSGSVGIGTTDPTTLASALQVHGRVNIINSNSYGFAHYNTSAADNQYLISQHKTSGDGFLLTVGKNGSVNAPYFALGTVDTERMRIDTSGNMYLGLTGNPSGWGSAIKYAIRQASASGYTGFVAFASGNDNAIAVGHDGTKGMVGVSYATGSYTPLAFQTSGADRITIDTSGNVGIGTTSPSVKLHLYNSGDSIMYIEGGAGYEAGIWFRENGVNKWEIYKRANPDDLNFYSSDLSASVMTLAAAGGVGIGTLTPGSYKLYVQGDQYVSGTLTEGSSIALKENIDPITNALEVVTKLVGVTYDRKDGSAKNRAGLIAEEVDQVLPNIVKKDENGNASGIQYTNLIAYLIESIKELKAEIDVLKSK